MLVHVGQLDRLEKLSLDGSLVSDSGLMHMEGLTRLRWLNLRDTKIGDAGVDHLRRLTSEEKRRRFASPRWQNLHRRRGASLDLRVCRRLTRFMGAIRTCVHHRGFPSETSPVRACPS